jgi:hypothetical protein
MGYFTLGIVWCILGAILNPNLFLPYASAATTFIVFIRTKYIQLKHLSEQGKKIVFEYLNKITGSVMNKVLQILSNRIEGATRYVVDNCKELINGPEFSKLSEKITSRGLIPDKVIKDIRGLVYSFDSRAVISAGASALSNPQSIIADIENKIKEELVNIT